jgi:hypothetical protein
MTYNPPLLHDVQRLLKPRLPTLILLSLLSRNLQFSDVKTLSTTTLSADTSVPPIYRREISFQHNFCFSSAGVNEKNVFVDSPGWYNDIKFPIWEVWGYMLGLHTDCLSYLWYPHSMFPLSPSLQLLGNYYKTGHVHVIPRMRPMIGCTGPIWRSAASINVQKLQVLQSVC